jgi:hypothetical protein
MWTGCETEESGNRLVQPQKKESKQEREFGPHFSLILLLENAVFFIFSFSFFGDGCFRDSRAQRMMLHGLVVIQETRESFSFCWICFQLLQ